MNKLKGSTNNSNQVVLKKTTSSMSTSHYQDYQQTINDVYKYNQMQFQSSKQQKDESNNKQQKKTLKLSSQNEFIPQSQMSQQKQLSDLTLSSIDPYKQYVQTFTQFFVELNETYQEIVKQDIKKQQKRNRKRKRNKKR